MYIICSIQNSLKRYIIEKLYCSIRICRSYKRRGNRSYIRRFAEQKNKKILSLGFYQPFCDEYILASPLEVLAYIKHADYIVTDTFHGTVFSIKYQKKFGTIIRDSNRQKLGDLMHRFDVANRQITDLENISKICYCDIKNIV